MKQGPPVPKRSAIPSPHIKHRNLERILWSRGQSQDHLSQGDTNTVALSRSLEPECACLSALSLVVFCDSLQICRDPRECLSGHLFCASCILIWSLSGGAARARCPVCRAPGKYRYESSRFGVSSSENLSDVSESIGLPPMCTGCK